jgi:DNA-binding Xre family transcriptional regulator
MSKEQNREILGKELSLDELEEVAGGRISFKPLLSYLKAHDISMYTLIKDGVITATESTRIMADHNFRLSLVDKLCTYLKCQPEDIIAYIPDQN